MEVESIPQKPIRPTKKQRQLLTFIDNFIAGHGYSPSYREIMRGLDYRSVATVAVHIENLVSKGLLIKREHSARSLEVAGSKTEFKSNKVKPSQEKWLVGLVGSRFDATESQPSITKLEADELYILIVALEVLGFDSAAASFKERLTKVNKRV